MLEGFDFDSPKIASQLTGRLEAVKHYNGLPVPSSYFLAAMDRLRTQFLNVSLDTVLHPASPAAKRAAIDQQAAASAAPPVEERELTAQEYFERGFDTNDLDEKLRFYGKAIQLNPDYAAAFNNRGNVRTAKGDLQGALQDYDQAIRLKRDDAFAYNNRANARRAQGDAAGPVQDYSRAIRLNSNDGNFFYNRSILLYDLGDLAAGMNDYRKAIQLKPGKTFKNPAGVYCDVRGHLRKVLKADSEN